MNSERRGFFGYLGGLFGFGLALLGVKSYSYGGERLQGLAAKVGEIKFPKLEFRFANIKSNHKNGDFPLRYYYHTEMQYKYEDSNEWKLMPTVWLDESVIEEKV